MHILGDLLALSTALFYALSSIYNKRGLDKMDRDGGMIIILTVQNLINALGLLVLFLVGMWVPFKAGAVFWFALAGALTSFSGRYLLLESVKLNGPSRAGAFKVASPVFTLFIGTMILNEQLNIGSLIGAILALTGLYFISIRDISTEDEKKSSSTANRTGRWYRRNRGTIIGLLSGLSFAIGMTARKVGLQIWPSSLGGAMVGSIAAVTLTVLYFSLKGRRVPWNALTNRDGIDYYFSGALVSLGIIAFFMSLMHIPVAIANVIGSLEPLFTIAFAWFMLRSKERITKGLVGGAIMVTIGVALIFIY